MEVAGGETCPPPVDPALAETAAALNASGAWGFVVDRRWHLQHMTDEIRLRNGGLRELVAVPTGVFWFSREGIDVMLGWSGGVFSIDAWRVSLQAILPWLRADVGDAELRASLDPRVGEVPAGPCADAPETALAYTIPGRYVAAGAAVDGGQRPRRRDERGGAHRGVRDGRAGAGSKALVERLDEGDARSVGVRPSELAYVALGELGSATEKARRDAPHIPVCEL